MDIKTFTYIGIYLLCIFTISNCQLIAGSGDGIPGSGSEKPVTDDEDTTTLAVSGGSGDGEDVVTTTRAPVRRTTTTVAVPTRKSNPDDDGGDDSDVITIAGGSGDGQPLAGSGDGNDRMVTMALPRNAECSQSYCWCKSEEGLEIPGTRKIVTEIDFASFDCEFSIVVDPVTQPSVVISSVETMRPIVVEEVTTTTVAPVPTTPRPRPAEVTPQKTTLPPPYVVQTSTRFGKPADVTDPLLGVDSDGVFRGDDVEREPVDPERPLFTHPGILAAVIGGGVVALLCALLLVMFIVYRMRKKDEGSYPLDADSKPQRFHAYTRAPTKEFYA